MDNMFCFQCEQTARKQAENNCFTGCTMSGVCGKKPEIALEQDMLSCELIALAAACEAAGQTPQDAVDSIVDGLFTTLTNVSFDAPRIHALTQYALKLREGFGGKAAMPAQELFQGEENGLSLRSTLLFGLRGMAAFAHHARVLGKRDAQVDAWFIKGMAALTKEYSVDEWLALLMEFGTVNYQCMALLDEANTTAYGNPTPTQVPLAVEAGPFIVLSGHDLHDLQLLLEQTQGTDVAVYTHGEMLPAHGYPAFQKYPQLKGHFGTAWQNQQKELDGIPAPVLFTTNCLMTPKPSYADRVYTTSVVAFPQLQHIAENADGGKDFSVLIAQAIQLGGYAQKQERQGINGGTSVTTGFGRQTVLDSAPAILDAVRGGAISHFFLVGGCDGAKSKRSYYTEFVRQTPQDSIVLTLACGKFRINDLDAGVIGPFPRILDMGQCNDAYGAIQVALALANAFDCGVNDLPLTLVLSWYEQKAVCILLTLLALGIRNIYIGPSLPAFLSDAVVTTLVERFALHPITTPEQDLAEILGKQ